MWHACSVLAPQRNPKGIPSSVHFPMGCDLLFQGHFLPLNIRFRSVQPILHAGFSSWMVDLTRRVREGIILGFFGRQVIHDNKTGEN